MTFYAFSQILQKLEQTQSRLEMASILAELFGQLQVQEVKPASYLLQGRLTPLYQSLEFQLSTKMLIRALARVQALAQPTSDTNLFGESDATSHALDITSLYQEKGDIGEVAAEVLADVLHKKQDSSSSSTHLALEDVFSLLKTIALAEGSGSQERKLVGVVELLHQLDPVSAKYVARIILGKLRLGFSVMTMIDALSWAVLGDKSERDELEEAYNRRADIGQLAAEYLPLKTESAEKRLLQLRSIKAQLGTPVMPALCQRLNTAQEIFDKLTTAFAEPKYDGMRVQVHINKNDQNVSNKDSASQARTVQVFTRSLEDVSHMFPELASKALENVNCETAIFDGEVIGYDAETGDLLPFQDTITRRRKHEVAEKAKEVPVRCYVFDVLMLNGESLIYKKMQERKDLLKGVISDNEVYYTTPYFTPKNPEELRAYHLELLAENLEGAVVKRVDAPYISGRKGWAWVKIKEAEGTTGKLADTLDLVVMGYFPGRGKRAQFGLGALLLGVITEASDKPIKTIAKLGSGMTEVQLADLKQACDALAVSDQPAQYDVPKELVPSVWCQPSMVVEVAADELTNSPLHTAGIALRFPRLVRVRDDKTWDQATTKAELTDF